MTTTCLKQKRNNCKNCKNGKTTTRKKCKTCKNKKQKNKQKETLEHNAKKQNCKTLTRRRYTFDLSARALCSRGLSRRKAWRAPGPVVV